MENNQASLIDRFNQAGPTSAGPMGGIPDTGVLDKKTRKTDPNVGIVKSLNARRDLNETHDFNYWVAYDDDLNDYAAFNAICNKVMATRKIYNNFSGHPATDFTNLTPAEIQYFQDFAGHLNHDAKKYYSAFLGINFKKIGHAIGSAVHGVEHGIGWVGKEIGHGAKFVALGAAHGVRDVAVDTAHGVRSGAVALGHAGQFIRKEEVQAHKFVQHELGQAAKAVAPYWKVIASAALVTVLAVSGVGLPLAIAIGSATLTGLDAIPQSQPELPAGFGQGGGFGGDGAGAFPGDGSQPDEDQDTGDTGDGLTSQDLAVAQQQAEVQNDGLMQAQIKADKRKKLMIWGGGIVAVFAIYWFFFRK